MIMAESQEELKSLLTINTVEIKVISILSNVHITIYTLLTYGYKNPP